MTEAELIDKLGRLRQSANRLQAIVLGVDELMALEGERDAITESILDALRRLTSEEIEKRRAISSLEAFGNWLKRRRGTTLPDFAALYSNKAAFDKTFWGDPYLERDKT